jgi:biopolymer transport protein ExbB/TolQ
MEDAQNELAAARKAASAEHAAFHDKCSTLLKEIKDLQMESEKLEADLKNVKAELGKVENFSAELGLKNSEFASLRSETEKFALFLAGRGAIESSHVSYERAGFAINLKEFFESAKKEIRPGAIFYKIVPDNADEAVRNFNESNPQVLDIDPSMGRLAQSRHETLSARFKAGGIWMYPILFFGIAALAIGCFKLAASAKAKRAPKDIVPRLLSMIGAVNDAKASELASSAPYPYRDLLVSLVKNRNIEKPLLEEMSYEHMLDVGEKLHSGLGFISVTAAVSPLLGLLGTVTGIIKTFGDLSMYGAGNSQLMSAGISEALITTEFGLIVAIPAIVVHALLSRRAKAVLSDMEKVAAAFLSQNSK